MKRNEKLNDDRATIAKITPPNIAWHEDPIVPQFGLTV
jgi:hypothetical protein